MTKLTKAERDHLTLLHTAARDPMSTSRERATAQAQLVDQLVWTGRTDPMNGDLPRLLADLDAAEAERDARGDEARELRSVLLRHNFAPCDITACNCNGWHERSTGNGFYARFREIEEAVGEHDGQTLHDAVKQIVAERKAAVLWAEKAEKAMTCKGCGGTVSDHLAPDQGGCPGSFEIDGVQMVPLAGRNDAVAQRDRAESERDALKAKLADPRRVLIHETEVVATKEEIATLKARLADLSDADEELHTCRALVNATSENLSVDLERMVDDLAEANEKAALSGKDSHSWHELYKDTKAKLAACEAERDAQATELVDERDRAKAKLAAAESAHSELFLSGQVAELRGKLAAVVAAYDHVFGDFDHSALSVDARILFDAIAAARGGASRG